jgi:UDP-N-acetylmuramoylalanine-D-glutamate ligase
LQKLNNDKKHTPRDAFTACTAQISLLKTVTDAAKIAARLAGFLLSTARSSFDEFQNARNCGQKLCRIVKSISWGGSRVNPNINGQMTVILN